MRYPYAPCVATRELHHKEVLAWHLDPYPPAAFPGGFWLPLPSTGRLECLPVNAKHRSWGPIWGLNTDLKKKSHLKLDTYILRVIPLLGTTRLK